MLQDDGMEIYDEGEAAPPPAPVSAPPAASPSEVCIWKILRSLDIHMYYDCQDHNC